MDSGPSSLSDGTGGEACLGQIPEDLLTTREQAAGSQEEAIAGVGVEGGAAARCGPSCLGSGVRVSS